LENVNLWDAATGELLNTFGGHHQPVTEIDWQPNGELIATLGGDRWHSDDTAIRVWDTQLSENTALIHLLELPENHQPIGIDWSPDGKQIASGSSGNFYIWNIENVGHAQEIPLLETEALTGGVRWSPEGNQVAAPYISSGNGGAIYIYDVRVDEYSWGNASNVGTIWTWTPDNHLMWMIWRPYTDVGYSPPPIEPEVHVVGDADSDRVLVGLTQAVSGAFLSPNGHYAAAVDDTGNGVIWNVMTGAPITMVSDTASVVWSPDETRIAVQRSDGSVWILEADGTIETMLPTSASVQAPVGTFFWSPDSQKLAHLHDGVIDLWRLND
jgi:WD40 repeat protein